jgi:hypothetical protein
MKLHVQDADFHSSSKKTMSKQTFSWPWASFAFCSFRKRGGEWWSVVESGGAWWRVVERARQNRVVLLRGVPGSTESSCNHQKVSTFTSAGKRTFVAPLNRENERLVFKTQFSTGFSDHKTSQSSTRRRLPTTSRWCGQFKVKSNRCVFVTDWS